MRKKGDNKLLNKLVSDCITFRLHEKEALEYIEKEFGEPLSKRAYWDRRRRLLNDNSHKGWMDWFSRIGFVQSHRRQIDDIEKIHNDSMHRFYELAHPTPYLMQIINKGKPQQGDENIILKLKEDIRENIRLQLELGLGTPVISAIKRRIDDAYSLNRNDNTNNAIPRRKRYFDWYSEW